MARYRYRLGDPGPARDDPRNTPDGARATGNWPWSGEPPIFPLPTFTPTMPDVMGRRNLTPPAQPITTPQPGGTPAGAAGGLSGPVPIILPVHLYPPVGAFAVDLPINRVPAVLAAGATITLEWPQVPVTRIGIVRRAGLSTTDAANTQVIFLINRAPVPPGPFIGAIGDLVNPPELAAPIIVPGGQVFGVQITNLSAVAITVVSRTMGWLYAP
jgi:hypothetical protein